VKVSSQAISKIYVPFTFIVKKLLVFLVRKKKKQLFQSNKEE